MGLRLLSAPASTVDVAGLDARIQAAHDLAQVGVDKGDNARQMVLNDRPKITEAQTVAAEAAAKADAIDVKRSEYEAALGSSIADRKALHDQLDALVVRVNGLTPHVTQVAVGCRSVTALALAGQVSVVVPLSHAMPTGYTFEWSHSAVLDLTKVTVTETARTSTSLTLLVRASGLALVAGTLVVVAVA